jgi:hypothetical protein
VLGSGTPEKISDRWNRHDFLGTVRGCLERIGDSEEFFAVGVLADCGFAVGASEPSNAHSLTASCL